MKKDNKLVSESVIKSPGRIIKHPTMIRYFSERNGNGLLHENPNYVAVDIESDYQTGETMLIGCYDGEHYWYYEDSFLENLARLMKYAMKEKRAIVYWSRFDPLQLFRILLLALPEDKRRDALCDYEKISGSWDDKNQCWTNPPVLEVTVGQKRLGVAMAIRGCLQLFQIAEDSSYCDTIWTYNIAPFYAEPLAKTAKRYNLEWYSKISDEAHLLSKDEWATFKNPGHLRDIVLESNKYDSMAAWHLARKLGDDFATAFWGWYPKSHISVGSHGRAFIAAYAEHSHEDLLGETKKQAVNDDLRSLSIRPHLESWRAQLGDENFKDFYSAAHEVYKGAKIECYGYGFFKTACIADLTQAYPATEKELLDFRESTVSCGFGTPPDETPSDYVFARGTIHIPRGCEYHPFLIRKPGDDTTNICPTGEFIRTTYWKDERDIGLKMGITFDDELWYRIHTLGKTSVFAGAIQAAVALREKLRAAKDPNEFRPKQMAAAGYGIRFEATPLYKKTTLKKTVVLDAYDDYNPLADVVKEYRGKFDLTGIEQELKAIFDTSYSSIKRSWGGGSLGPDVIAHELEERGIYLQSTNPTDIFLELVELSKQKTSNVLKGDVEETEIVFDGLRAGDYFDPIAASRITMKTRVKITEACLAIVKAGGRPIFAQTDSVAWDGRIEMLPEYLWREKKTLGFFEKPAYINDLVSLGAGRYEYLKADKDTGEMTSIVAKSRGVYMEKLLDAGGVELNDVCWRNALRHLNNNGMIVLRMNVLVTPGLIAHSRKYTDKDLGRIVLITKVLDPVTGRKKRRVEVPNDLSTLADSHIWSEPPHVVGGMVPGEDDIDDTLPELRNEMQAISMEEEKKTRSRPHNRDDDEKRDRRLKYFILRGHGFEPIEASKYSFWSLPKIMELIKTQTT